MRAIGFKGATDTIPSGQATADIGLEPDPFKLEEVVVTGQSTGIERKNLANAISTVSAADLGDVPTASVEQQLQGKVAGADIQTNSGAPGGGVQVRMRGITSINAAAEPLYVVDGVIVADVAIPSNQNAVTAATQGSNRALTQDAQVNRIADLDPNDIANIEILKGASASAIYGGRASNGVVIITTKRGRTGPAEVNVSQKFGFSELSNEFGSRVFKTAGEVDSTYGAGTAAGEQLHARRPVRSRETVGRQKAAVQRDLGQHQRWRREHQVLCFRRYQARCGDHRQYGIQATELSGEPRPAVQPQDPGELEHESPPHPCATRAHEQRQ